MVKSDLSFSAILPHFEFDKIKIDMRWNRVQDCAEVCIKVNDGWSNPVTLTAKEMRSLLLLVDRFEESYASMTKGEK